MPPKRRADDELTSIRPKKILKLKIAESDDKINNQVDFDKKKRIELEHALHEMDNERVLDLSLEFIQWQAASSKLGIRLLNFFVKTHNQQMVRKVLKHRNFDLGTPLGGMLLRRSVINGQVEIAEMLVRARANLTQRESDNNSSILHTVLTCSEIKGQEKKENLASLMLEYGADVNAVDKDGCSILHRAIKDTFSTTFIEKLLQHGANVRINNNTYLNDIYTTLHYKPELLLRLIQHQVPDDETRNRRGVIAIEYLISRKGAGKVELIKSILDLGVPVNNPDPMNPLGLRGVSLLHCALRTKKIDVIKLLLKNGADVHEKNENGSTPLYEAALIFKGFSDASRLLIIHGASINQPNNDGRLPIHGACANESLRNVHLFLSLGANLAVTDNNGYTPFDSMSIRNISLTDAGRLVIKHFALMTSKGIPLLEKDLEKINRCYDVREFYHSCLEELDNMKKETVCDDIPYYSLLSDNVNDMLLLAKNANFVKAFEESNTKTFDLFAIYFYNLKISFEIAVNKLKILESRKKVLEKVFGKIFPPVVIEKIAFYASLRNMMDCEKSSYLVLHQNTKHNKISTRILI